MMRERGIRIQDCRHAVERLMRISEGDMLGPSIERRFSWPRQIAMALAREMTGASLTRIGRHFRRDHSTVLHAIRRVAKSETAHSEIKITMDALRRSFAAEVRNSSENRAEEYAA